MIKYGCDPEVFLKDKITGDFVSAFGHFPGTKSNPFKVDKGAVQVDGMALEFNIDPAETEKEFVKNISDVLAQMNEMVRDKTPDYEIVFEPFANFDRTYFIIQPFEPKVLGCDPDFDEYGTEKIPPDGLQDQPFRTAAGHVHIGWTEGQDPFSFEHFESCKKIASAFKKVEGYAPMTTAENARTRYYGMPGSFRPKPYGIELRSPSNLWVKTPEGRSKMFQNTCRKMMELGDRYEV